MSGSAFKQSRSPVRRPVAEVRVGEERSDSAPSFVVTVNGDGVGVGDGDEMRARSKSSHAPTFAMTFPWQTIATAALFSNFVQ